MNNKNGFAAAAVLVFIVIVILAGGLIFAMSKRNSFLAAQPAPTAGSTQAVVQDQNAAPAAVQPSVIQPAPSGWLAYSFGGSAYVPAISFEYPADWSVSQSTYATPAEQANGNPGAVEGLKIASKADPANYIFIGGRQAECGAAIAGQRACFKNVPVVASNGSFAAVFIRLVASLR